MRTYVRRYCAHTICRKEYDIENVNKYTQSYVYMPHLLSVHVSVCLFQLRCVQRLARVQEWLGSRSLCRGLAMWACTAADTCTAMGPS